MDLMKLTRFCLAGLALAGFLLVAPAACVRADDDNTGVYGTIVSVRGNILEIRPSLRPKRVRVAVDAQTAIVEDKLATADVLKVGLRVASGGPYDKTKGYHPVWVEVAEHPVGFMAQKYDGIKVQGNGAWANAGGTLKSLKPFVITDDKGKDLTIELDQVKSYWTLNTMDRSSLLIGVHAYAEGPKAADGVIKANSVAPDRDFVQAGTMFGTILGRRGNVLDVLPRYQTESIPVTIQDHCTIQRQVDIDPDSVKIGDTVTFWATPHNQSWQLHKTEDLTAIMLLLGDERYPLSAPQGDGAPVFKTGKLAALDPSVQLELPSGKRLNVIIPAQMPVARLSTATVDNLKAGTPAMFVLTRDAAGAFVTKTIMLDASPWVGYGE